MLKAVVLLLLSLPAFANSVPITTFQLSGIGSGLNNGQFWASDPSPNFSYTLNAFGGTGSFGLQDGSTHLFGGLSNYTLTDSLFTGTFTGDEIVRLGNQDWVYWLVTGTISETVNYSAPDGTGTINITSAVFEGKYAVAPEPGTWVLVGTGILIMCFRKFVPARSS